MQGSRRELASEVAETASHQESSGLGWLRRAPPGLGSEAGSTKEKCIKVGKLIICARPAARLREFEMLLFATA